MCPTILVTGGTGTLGRELVPLLIATGRPLRVLSRHSHLPVPGVDHVVGDLLRDDGTTAAVADVGTVVHLAGGRTGDERATANLVRAAARAGVEHVVLISVIGADRVPLGYFRSKLLAEEAVETSGLPWTTLRAAQFHPWCSRPRGPWRASRSSRHPAACASSRSTRATSPPACWS